MKAGKHNQTNISKTTSPQSLILCLPALQTEGAFFKDDTMKHIKLTQGKTAYVDNEDYLIVSQNKWHISKGYAVRDILLRGLDGEREQIHISMHQQIMNTPQGYDTHHKNDNRLDNRRKNLVICTRKEHFEIDKRFSK